MGWVRLDDAFYDHPKLAAVGPLGIALWATALGWCNRNLTDGHLPASRARTLLDFDGIAVVDGMHGEDVTAQTVIDQLVAVGLWDETDGGYEVHDYLDFQPSAEQIRARQVDQHNAKVLAGKKRAAGAQRDQHGRLKTGRSQPPEPAPQPPPTPPDEPALDQQPHQQTGQQPTSPNPNPNTANASSSSPVTAPRDPQADDDDDQAKLAEAAIDLLAHRDLDRCLAAGRHVGLPDPWLASARRERRRRHADRLATLPGTFTSADQLADWLEPSHQPATKPGPLDATQAAGRRRDERAEAEARARSERPCRDCDGGLVDNPDGGIIACATCSGTGAILEAVR